MSPKKKQVKPIKRENREKERMTKSKKGENKTRKGRKVSERVKTSEVPQLRKTSSEGHIRPLTSDTKI